MGLYPFQKEDIRKWYYDLGGRGIFDWGIGSGKGQPYGSKVLTPKGWIPIETLCIGDMIYASDGNSYPISGVFPKQEIDTYKFLYSDNTSCVFDKDHLHIVRSLKDRFCEKRYRKNRGWRVLPTTYFLDKKLIRGRNKVYDIPIVKPINFMRNIVDINPYLLGVLLGDGCLKIGVTFTNNDEFLIDKIYKIVNDEDMNIVHRGKGTYAITSNTHSHNPLLRQLKEYKLFGCGSHDKFIPEEYLCSEESIRWSLLAGIMDTDGYVESGVAMITTTSPDLRDGIIDLCRSLGSLPTYITKENPKYTYNNEIRYGKTAYIIRLGNLQQNPFTLPRKALLWNNDRKINNCRYITSIEYVGKQKTVCISVDSPDHSYITENYIVTHNTFSGAKIVKRMVELGHQVLVVTTKALIDDWSENLENEGVAVYNYYKKKKQDLQQVSMTSYDMLKKVINEHYDFVIADEVHKAKSISSQRGKAFRQIARRARYLLMMTGTLYQGKDAAELINYLWCIDSTKIRLSMPENITRFRALHCMEKVMENGYRFFITKRSGTELINKLIKPYVLTRKTEDVLDLPEHIISKQGISGGFSEKETAKKLSEDLNMSIDLAYEKPHIMHALQMANGIDPDTKELVDRSKLEAVLEKVSSIPEDKQIIIWTYWRSFTEAIAKSLKVKPIHGGTPDAERKGIIDDFRGGKKRILIAGMGTIAEGFNLQNCNIQIFANIWYDWIKYTQCTGRIYRNGQKYRTLTHLIYTRGTIEKDALYVLDQKMKINEANDYLRSIMLQRYGRK